MKLLRVVKLLVLSYVRDFAVGVVAVVAKVHLVPPSVPVAGFKVAVSPVLVSVVDVVVHSLFAVRAYSVLLVLFDHDGWVDCVDASRVHLVDEWQARMVHALFFVAHCTELYFHSPAVSADPGALVLFQHTFFVLFGTLLALFEVFLCTVLAGCFQEGLAALTDHFQGDDFGLHVHGVVESYA